MTDTLIARLRKATGRDPELDTAIHEAIHGPLGKMERPQRYTASLDAARSLVPDKWQWHMGTCNEDDSPWACISDPEGKDFACDGAVSPAVALCIAALLARGIE